MRILDPTDERVPVRRSLAARPEGVIGTVGLLDINKARGDRGACGVLLCDHGSRGLAGLRAGASVSGRGRDASYLAPPAQIRTCGFPAYGSYLGSNGEHSPYADQRR